VTVYTLKENRKNYMMTSLIISTFHINIYYKERGVKRDFRGQHDPKAGTSSTIKIGIYQLRNSKLIQNIMLC
jgi:hypothetical protein